MRPIPIQRSLRAVGTTLPSVVGKRRSRKVGIWPPLLVVAMLALVVGGIQVLRHWRSVPRLPNRTELVTRGAVVGLLKAEGRLQSQATVRVGSISAGQVMTVDVDVGDRVRRGQPLARLDNLEQKAAAAEASASADAAQIGRARAEKRLVEQLDRLDDAGSSAGDLGPDDVLGGSAGDAQLDLMSAYVQVGRADSKRALARGVLARRVIRAPIDGVVLTRSVDPGETISFSPPGPPLFVIGSDPSRLRLEVEADNAEATRVQPSSVKLVVPDYPRRSFTASIRQVLPASSAPISGGRYRILLDVENRDGALRPGMSATIALPMETAANAVRVPVAALVPAPPHSGARDAVVWVVDGHGVLTSVPVETGVVNDRIAEIRGGSLRPGATVVVAGTP
jgi:HlyD family secretion protein